MDDPNEFDDMRNIVDELDHMIHHRITETIDELGEDIALGVLVCLGTSLIAKAVLLAPARSRDELGVVITKTIAVKLAEGGAALESAKAIGKAMGKMH